MVAIEKPHAQGSVGRDATHLGGLRGGFDDLLQKPFH
jgi:hypothetical protein